MGKERKSKLSKEIPLLELIKIISTARGGGRPKRGRKTVAIKKEGEMSEKHHIRRSKLEETGYHTGRKGRGEKTQVRRLWTVCKFEIRSCRDLNRDNESYE